MRTRDAATRRSTRVVVDRLGPGDVWFAAALHRRALPHGFFARLGRRFLRAYYRSFMASPHAVALVARVDGRRVGVVVGATAHRAHWRWVARAHGVRLAAVGTWSLATHPAAAARFVRTRVRRYARGLVRLLGPEPLMTPGGRSVAVLTHVSVAPGARGAGVGTALVAAFVAAARAAGAGEVQLVTLADARGAGGFYRALGWQHAGERHSFDGRVVARYRLPLTGPGRP